MKIMAQFTVNFRDAENVSEIFQSFQGNRIIEGKMAEIFCKLQENLIDYDFSNSQQEEILAFAANQNENQQNEVNEELLLAASKILHNTNPG